ncbi:MAG: MaoC family dehydratase [SAR202 cluster bacterium]|nr:MaoC family dehydratase [SAR202 cluster bacterium]|tara:strand:- start:1422 stop:1871 length:450 start_codon:yes stop_codon:yes gene_type:complete
MELKLEYDKSLYGKEHVAGPFTVTEEMIRAFAKATGDLNPVYTDESQSKALGYEKLVAPPTMCTMFVRQVKLPDIKLNFGKNRFHAGQRVSVRKIIEAGDELTASSHLKEVYPKTGRSGTMVFIVWETTFTNQNGDVVADVQESFATRE